MNALLAATTVLSLLAIWFVFRSLGQLRRGRIRKSGGSLIIAVLAGALGAVGIVVSYSYLSYERLTNEESIGQIEFVRISDERYEARLMVSGERDRIVTLNGNEWQLDARIVTWKPPFTLMGLEPIYKLERLSGRYTDIEKEQTAERTVHALSETDTIDVWTLAQEVPTLVPGIDAYYGTATYLPMADRARYDLSMSRDALIARPVNEAARTAVGSWNDQQ